jgi:hypothetical protein
MSQIKPLAIYLPQFHPIPENDKWWGKGFTEWTNVAKATPLFEGHWQPRLPSDLGFYDLRVPEVREAQAQLASEHGIYGFCYWHYWFGGRRIIERPFIEVVQSGQPDFPFCVAWANQTWAGTWHGLSSNETLIEQTYPGREDYTAHFYSLLNAFNDKRYIEINGKKLVFIFRPQEIPDSKGFIDLWQELALKEGMNGIHFVGMHMPFNWDAAENGYDGAVPEFFHRNRYEMIKAKPGLKELLKKVVGNYEQPKLPQLVSYENYVSNYPEKKLVNNQYPWIMPDWDNTPRAGANGWLFRGSSPELFGQLCKKAFKETENKSREEKIIVLRSWNEWAEGNYLEPDQKFGTSYLEVFKQQLDKYSNGKE